MRGGPRKGPAKLGRGGRGRGGEARRGGGGCAWATRRGGQEAGPPRRVERVGGAAAKLMEAAFNGARRGSVSSEVAIVHTFLIDFYCLIDVCNIISF